MSAYVPWNKLFQIDFKGLEMLYTLFNSD